LQAVVPGTVPDISCEAENLCKAAVNLCTAEAPTVDAWISMLALEERTTCIAFSDLIARSPLKVGCNSHSPQSASSTLSRKIRAAGNEEAGSEIVVQVLDSVETQLSTTRESLIKALNDMETRILERLCDPKPSQRHDEFALKRSSISSAASRSSSNEDGTPQRHASAPLKGCLRSRSRAHTTGQPRKAHDKEELLGHVHHFEKDPSSDYSISGYKLGAGTFGVTHVGRHKESGHERAIKSVQKAFMNEQVDVWKEIKIMKGLDHPNIVKLFATYEDSRQMFLVMELCSGGELFDAIVESKEGLSENVAAKLFRQALLAVAYLHMQKICHRDLKPENFLLTRKVDDREKIVKLIDFGHSKSFANGEVLTTKVFTVHYVAHEVLNRQPKPYTEVCDVWSLGVILFLLLAGRPPFNGEDDMAVMKAVKKGKYEMQPESVWNLVSGDAVDLIKAMLEVQPTKRLQAQAALEHRWIAQLAPNADNQSLATEAVFGLRSFVAQNKLKMLALQVVAKNISDEHIDQLKVAFSAQDKDHEGSLGVSKIEAAIRGLGLDVEAEKDLCEVLTDIGNESDGIVNYTQFLAATIDRKKYMQEHALKEVFDAFDLDGDGNISKVELAAVLSGKSEQPRQQAKLPSDLTVDADDLDAILDSVDKDGDGNIDFKEFMEMMG
jgi:calcium-dependent protein kinase